MTCIAIDDEELALDLLEDNIGKVSFLTLLGRFTSPVKAMQFLQVTRVDLVFLDVQMPRLNGLQFIQNLADKPMFILVTAYEKFALDGFNLNVVDYLLKPVESERFVQACTKAHEIYQLKNIQPGKANLEDEYFFLKVDYSLVKINFGDIIWIEGLRDYVKIHLVNKQHPLIARTSIRALEEQLPVSLFVRIHKSYMVSKKFVTAITKAYVILDKVQLNIGDRYKNALTRLIN